jgi:hypothetical protein
MSAMQSAKLPIIKGMIIITTFIISPVIYINSWQFYILLEKLEIDITFWKNIWTYKINNLNILYDSTSISRGTYLHVRKEGKKIKHVHSSIILINKDLVTNVIFITNGWKQILLHLREFISE